MNIIILGAGQVGAKLTEHLVHEENDITVVDQNPDVLSQLQQRLDIRTIQGIASHPDVLTLAGGEEADMVIAVTNSDEVNMLACQVAYALFQTPTKIARVRAIAYQGCDTLFCKDAIPIDVLIHPEQLVTHYVMRLMEFPGALQVLDFAHGLAQLVAVQPYYGGPLVGKTVAALYENLKSIPMKIVAIFRRNQSIPVGDQTVIEARDELFFIATPSAIKDILRALGRFDNPYRRVMIAGGGHIGRRLAAKLENNYQVKIIEQGRGTAESIATELHTATVLHGDASDRDLLVQENIEYTDVFCAVTNDDEANIMSCMQAKRLGVRKVMALINRTAYVDLIEGSEIDIAISPHQATIGQILKHIRTGDVVNVHALRRGAAEAIELIAHGDAETSFVVGRAIKAIPLPPGTTIGAIVRDHKTIIAYDDMVIESGDHVCLFVVDKKHISALSRLFQVKLSYIGMKG